MQDSKIEWTDHTFNPWHGCFKVSPGCQHCYAETLNHRYGFSNWGPAKTTSRRMMSENYWKQPHKWNKEAAAAGVRRRVFCASMADVFEDHPQVGLPRAQLFTMIEATPALDWLLLTKRPENMTRFTPDAWRGGWPANAWAMTSVENQEQADKRIPELLKVPASIRGLSCEPLLEAVDLGRWIIPASEPVSHIDWVIVGGESGHGARPMHPAWARGLRDQCQASGVAFFFKQWGEYKPAQVEDDPHFTGGRAYNSARGGRSAVALRERSNKPFQSAQWRAMKPGDETVGGCVMLDEDTIAERVGKHAAGRELDGRTWDEVPS